MVSRQDVTRHGAGADLGWTARRMGAGALLPALVLMAWTAIARAQTDAGNSTCVAATGTAVADGVDTDTIVVTLLDAGNAPVVGHTVTLAVSAGGAANVTIGPPSGPSNATGVVAFTVSCTQAKTVSFEATDTTDAVTVTQDASVTFVHGPTDPAVSTVAATVGSAIADGVDTDTITVTLLDATSNPVSGHTVALAISAAPNPGAVSIGAASGASNVNGQVTFQVRSTVPQTATFRASDLTEPAVITPTADVIFTANTTDAGNSTVTAADGAANSDGVDSEPITVTLLNALGNPVPGHNVSLAVSAGGAGGVTINPASNEAYFN